MCSSDNVWRMSKRARRNVSQGHGPKVRRPPDIEARGERSYDPMSGLNQLDVRANDLPVMIDCPACGIRQIAGRELLLETH